MPTIVIVILVVVIGLILLIATRPGTFRIQRTAIIAAPASAVFALLNDFHAWPRWSPWEGRDPDMKRTFDGPPAGVGAVYGWVGNSKVGEGRMTITESQTNERLALKLEFIKPWTATNQTEFIINPAAGGVTVVWAMTGTSNFMAKAFGLFMNLDKVVGKDFEEGLAKMKVVAEGHVSAAR